MTRNWIAISAMFLGAVISLPGCGGGADTPEAKNGDAAQSDPHDVPLTDEEIAALKEENSKYQDAIASIKQYRDTIKQECEAGHPAKAHRPLDNLDVVLEHLPKAAQNSEIPKEKWEDVNTTSQKLRDLFNQVHANIDGGKEPDYASVADEVDAAIAKLEGISG